MKHCKTCKHWEAPTTEYGEVPGTGKCKFIKEIWGVAEWDSFGDKRALREEFKNHLAFVEDGSGYYAALRTKAEFGCVHHQEV